MSQSGLANLSAAEPNRSQSRAAAKQKKKAPARTGELSDGGETSETDASLQRFEREKPVT